MDRRRKRIIAFLQRSSALGRKEGRKEDTGRRGGRDDRDPIGRKGRLSFVSLSLSLSPVGVYPVGAVQWPLSWNSFVSKFEGGGRRRDGSSAFCGAFHIGSVLSGAWGSPLLPSPPHPPPLPKSSS